MQEDKPQEAVALLHQSTVDVNRQRIGPEQFIFYILLLKAAEAWSKGPEIRQNWLFVVRTLIALNADVDAVDQDSNTPLHRAARLDDSDQVIVLLRLPSQLIQLNADGQTALHCISRSLDTELLGER